MKRIQLLPTLAGTLCLLAPFAAGHGGTYRGPGDTVPPGGSASGGSGGPAKPGTGPGQPGSTGGVGAPRGGSPFGGPGQPGNRGSRTGGDSPPDLTAWTFWWEFNKDAYLDLKRKVYAGQPITGDAGFFLGKGQRPDDVHDIMRPDPQSIRSTVVPALVRALESDQGTDVITGAMIALAKIGEVHGESGESEVRELLIEQLTSKTKEVSETAALALGIRGHEDAIDLLTDLLHDTQAGRILVQEGEVPFRTRAFAAYGLGVIGSRADEGPRKLIVERLVDAVEGDDTKTRDLQVSCILAMGLVPLPEAGSMEAPGNPTDSRAGQIAYLQGLYQDDDRSEFTRAHCPISMARLALADILFEDEEVERQTKEAFKSSIVEVLLPAIEKRSKARNSIQQSAAQTLGLLGDTDDDGDDVRIRAALTAAMMGDIKDQQTRRFAAIALAKVGANPGNGDGKAGSVIRSRLLASFSKGQQTMQSWAGLALGVHGRAMMDRGEQPPPELLEALRVRMEKEDNNERLGAFAVASGILKDVEAETLLIDKLVNESDDVLRGYIALALGLIGERSASTSIRKVLEQSKYRPALLRQAAIALGLLGDKDVVPLLSENLRDANTLATRAALAAALGAIGDKRSIAPLVEMLEDKTLTDAARGFAAAALGIVADKEMLPWNSRLAIDVNYRASTETLTAHGIGTGVLDIL